MVPGKEGRQRGIAPVVGSPGHYRVLSLASPTGAPRSVIQHFGIADGPIETGYSGRHKMKAVRIELDIIGNTSPNSNGQLGALLSGRLCALIRSYLSPSGGIPLKRGNRRGAIWWAGRLSERGRGRTYKGQCQSE